MSALEHYGPTRSAQLTAIIKVLLEAIAAERLSISYSDLADSISSEYGVSVHWRNFGQPLSDLQAVCKDLNAPCLPVMVVDKGTETPGVGFKGRYVELHPEYSAMEESEMIRREREHIRNYENWNGFLEACGIADFEFGYLPATKVSKPRAEEYVEFLRFKEQVLVAEQHRNREARRKCLEKFGAKCQICGFESEAEYGIPGIIEVHHKDPVADIDGSRTVNPETDLIPLCPNCHAIVHSKKRDSKGGYNSESVYTVEEVKAMRAAVSATDA